MAKRIVDEEMRFKIIVNGNEAQKELLDLEKANRDLLKQNRANRTEQRRLEKQGKQNTARYKELSASIRKNSDELKGNYARMNKLEKQLGVTDLSMAQLQNRLKALRVALRNSDPNSQKYKEYEQQIREVNARLSELNARTRAAKGGLQGLADKFNRYSALIGGVAIAIAAVVFQIQKLVDFNGKLSDAMSDVQKTTGLAKKEVEDLSKSFGALKTRTDRINLLKIAEEGGRIGIAKEEIGQFVEVMNKAVVALGDSFPGGAEETAQKLGKLKLLFKETKDQGVDEAYNAIGSAINELGANGVATEINIANFATRIGSMPDAIKPTVSQALALGAAFEESGIEAEIAARAYNIFLRQASTETEKFAKVMGLTKDEVAALINQDPLEFMIEFAKGVKGMSATETAQTLDYLGVSADGANKILGALSNNTEVFRSRLQLSNRAMEQGTSLINEYNIKNNNFAATLDKLKKAFNAVFLSQTLVSAMSGFVEWFSRLLGVTEDVTGSGRRWREFLVFLAKIIVIATTSLISYNAALKLSALLTKNAYRETQIYILTQKAFNLATRVGTGLALLFKAAFYVLTGQISKATQVMRVFNYVTKLNPWGLIIGILGTVVAAYIAFSDEAKKAATQQSFLNDAIAKAKEKTAGTIAKMQALQEVVNDTTASEEARKKAIEQLNYIIPDYNKNTDLSSEALKKGKEKLDAYIESLQKQAEAQYLADQVALKSKELKKNENSTIESHIKWYEQLWSAVKSGGNAYAYMNEQLKTGLQNRRESIALSKQELEAAKAAYKKYIVKNPDANVTEESFVSTFKPPGGIGDGNDQAKKDAEKRKEDLRKIYRDEIDLKQSLIKDSFEREMEQLHEQHKRKVEDLKAQLVTEGKLSEDQIAMNGSIRRQIGLQDEIFRNEQGKIIEKNFEQEAVQLDEKFKRESARRLRAHNNALAALGSNEKEKKRLQEQFNKEELERQQVHLREMTQSVSFVLGNENFKGFQLSLLTEEQKKEQLERLEQLKDALAAIGIKIAGIKSGKTEGEFEVGGLAGDVDILGFTVDQWGTTFDNLDTVEEKIAAVQMGLGAMMNAWKMYGDFLDANEKRDLENFKKKTEQKQDSLKRQLDAGVINQRQYDAAIANSELELKKKQAELDYKKAKREKDMAVAGIIINTSLAVAKALPNIPLSIIVGAIGATQLGLTLAQPLPARGFQDGYYNVQREQDGKLYNAKFGGTSRSGIVDFPTVFLAGEEGRTRPEMIISGQDYGNFSEGFKESLYRELSRVQGFATGYYKAQPAKQTKTESSAGDGGFAANIAMSQALNRNSDILEKLEKEGVIAILADNTENAKRIKDSIKKYDRLRNSNRF